MKSRLIFASVLALLCSTAYATNKPKDPPKLDPVPTVSTSTSNAAASAQSNAAALAGAAAVSGSVSNATGGNAAATGGDVASYAQGGRGGNGYGVGVGAAAAGDSEASASADGTQTTNVDASSVSVWERQVPAMIMGTVIPVDCGFGGQAGAANTSGAGFLGAAWTTETCYALKVANAFAAIGEYSMACELWVGITQKMLRKRRNIVNVDCNTIVTRLHALRAPPPAPVITTAPAPNNYVTREELREYMDRVFRQGVSK